MVGDLFNYMLFDNTDNNRYESRASTNRSFQQ